VFGVVEEHPLNVWCKEWSTTLRTEYDFGMPVALFEFGGFFVGSSFATFGAIFVESQFIRCIELVFLHQIVL